MSRESCRGCYYYRLLNSATHEKCCHFMLETGEQRNCPPERCLRYLKKEPPKFPFVVNPCREKEEK